MSGNPASLLQRLEPDRDPFGEHMLAVHAEPEARDRNAHLRRRDVAVLPFRIFENVQHASGEPAALRRLILDARARRTDDRELRCDEQSVRQHEQQDDREHDGDGGHFSASTGAGTTRAGNQRLNGAFGDSLDLELIFANGHAVAGCRQPAKYRRDEAAHGRRVRFPRGVQQGGCVVHRHFTGDANASVGERFHQRLARLELVSDVAEQLREHVFECEQAGSPAEFVHDERLMRPAFAQLAQDSIDGDAFVHAGDRPQETVQRDRLFAA